MRGGVAAAHTGPTMTTLQVAKPAAPRAPRRAALSMTVRVWHSHAGAFFAPAILFFALTGALQTFDLHKPKPGYFPPAAVQAMASMHKDQDLHVKYGDEARARTPARPDAGAGPAGPKALARQALKAFVALMSAGLAATTLLGLYMSWQTARRRAVLLWFAAGLALPLLLMVAAA